MGEGKCGEGRLGAPPPLQPAAAARGAGGRCCCQAQRRAAAAPTFQQGKELLLARHHLQAGQPGSQQSGPRCARPLAAPRTLLQLASHPSAARMYLPGQRDHKGLAAVPDHVGRGQVQEAHKQAAARGGVRRLAPPLGRARKRWQARGGSSATAPSLTRSCWGLPAQGRPLQKCCCCCCRCHCRCRLRRRRQRRQAAASAWARSPAQESAAGALHVSCARARPTPPCAPGTARQAAR